MGRHESFKGQDVPSSGKPKLHKGLNISSFDSELKLVVAPSVMSSPDLTSTGIIRSPPSTNMNSYQRYSKQELFKKQISESRKGMNSSSIVKKTRNPYKKQERFNLANIDNTLQASDEPLIEKKDNLMKVYVSAMQIREKATQFSALEEVPES